MLATQNIYIFTNLYHTQQNPHEDPACKSKPSSIYIHFCQFTLIPNRTPMKDHFCLETSSLDKQWISQEKQHKWALKNEFIRDLRGHLVSFGDFLVWFDDDVMIAEEEVGVWPARMVDLRQMGKMWFVNEMWGWNKACQIIGS